MKPSQRTFRPEARPSLPALTLAVLLAGCASGPATPPPPATAASAPQASAPDAPPAARQSDAKRQAEFDRSMALWHGASLRELLSKLGSPDQRARLRSGQWQYSYLRSTTLRGPAGPRRFSCIVHYRVDARREFIVGHRIQGC